TDKRQALLTHQQTGRDLEACGAALLHCCIGQQERHGMKTAPIPHNEKERLAALHALLILDTPPEQRFDRITEFAAAEFDAPICLISLVDENRQWFKSRIGIDVCETPRSLSFCAYALHSTETLVVPDTHADERFADHPVVVDPPHL